MYLQTHSFRGFNTDQTRRHSSTSSSENSSEEPEVPPEPQESTFTKTPPSTYRAAGNFPTPSTEPQDLPPPYPGSLQQTAGFAYPPQAANVTPYPTAPAPGGPGYPSATQFVPTAPAPSGPGYPSATQLDPAYLAPPQQQELRSLQQTAGFAYPPQAANVTPYPTSSKWPWIPKCNSV